jgi:microsomal epoxide hydrolase
MMNPTPFTIYIDEDILLDLRERLARVRWPDEIPGSEWQYGTDLTYLQALAEYWHDEYTWRAHAKTLKQVQQFTAPVADIDLHFIHEPGKGPDPLPLLLMHGWPGSVWEFYKVLPLLTDPARFGGDAQGAFTSHSAPL